MVVGDDRPCLPRTSFTLGSRRGYISSAVADTTQRGSTQCPWVVEARRGQRVNVTLWDFGSGGGTVVPSPAAVDDLAQTCQAYAVIRERAPARSFTVRQTIRRFFCILCLISMVRPTVVIGSKVGLVLRRYGSLHSKGLNHNVGLCPLPPSL